MLAGQNNEADLYGWAGWNHLQQAQALAALEEGRLRYSVDGEVRDLGPGERMYTPRGAVHGFSNPHDRPARALIVLTPDIGAQYFRDVAAVAGAPGGPNPANIAEVMTRYGLVLAPPPKG